MRLLLAFALAAAPCFGAYAYHETLTINHLKVENTNYAGPVMDIGTYAYLKTVGNSGHVQSASGFDIVYGTTADCTTLYPFERVAWSATTGAIVFKINIGTVSTSVDTVYYRCWGDVGVTTDQSSPTTTYDANTVQAWNMETTTVTSSTTSPISLTNTAATSAAGQIGNGLVFNGTSAKLQSASSIPLAGVVVVTVEFWLKWTSFASGVSVLMETGSNYGTHNGDFFMVPNDGSGAFLLGYASNTTGTVTNYTFTRPSATVWHHYGVVINTASGTAAGTLKVYVDGVSQTLTALGSPFVPTAAFTSQIWNFMSRNGASLFANGSLDNLQISNVGRTNDWFTTRWNNGSAPATFTGGSGEIGGGALLSSLVPTAIAASTAGNTINLTGTTTSWTAGTPGTPTFTTTAGCTITGQVVSSATAAALTVTAGGAAATCTITDPSTSTTLNLSVISAASAPASATISFQ